MSGDSPTDRLRASNSALAMSIIQGSCRPCSAMGIRATCPWRHIGGSATFPKEVVRLPKGSAFSLGGEEATRRGLERLRAMLQQLSLPHCHKHEPGEYNPRLSIAEGWIRHNDAH